MALQTGRKTLNTESDLAVFTALKKLTAYVISATEKSPKHFRGVFVTRMQNYCLDSVENLYSANAIMIKTEPEFEKRRFAQDTAILKLKTLGYVSVLALDAKCITQTQFREISNLNLDCINLISAWRKSDTERWRKTPP
jgi:hypothetical protein